MSIELTEYSLKNIKYIQDLSNTKTNLSNKPTHSINIILDAFYKDFFHSYFLVSAFLKEVFQHNRISIKKIINPSQIQIPKSFTFQSIPKEIGQHIQMNTVSEIIFSFTLYQFNISLLFYLEKHIPFKKIFPILLRILIWLHMIYTYKQSSHLSSDSCSPPKTLQCFFYLSSLKKELPTYIPNNQSIQTLSETHANTAFTRSCSENINEIIVYRMEEWFKVFIHETIHTFGLDFSDFSIDKLSKCTQKIQNTFLVNSDINLYESYTEFWAEIINAMFCSMFITFSLQWNQMNYLIIKKQIKKKECLKQFQNTSISLWNIERTFGILQMHKVLNFMGLTYHDLCSHSVLVKEKYREKTSIFSYYILKNILLFHYEDFFQWILTYSLSNEYTPFLSYVHFTSLSKSMKKKNERNELEPFCSFLLTHYKTKLPDYSTKKQTQKTMRMTVCELTSF